MLGHLPADKDTAMWLYYLAYLINLYCKKTRRGLKVGKSYSPVVIIKMIKEFPIFVVVYTQPHVGVGTHISAVSADTFDN